MKKKNLNNIPCLNSSNRDDGYNSQPIIQLKELEPDRVRWDQWKALVRQYQMKVNKDQKEQLEHALSELEEAKKTALKLQRQIPSVWIEDITLIIGGIDLASGWIKRVIDGKKLFKNTQTRRKKSQP